MRKTNRPQLTNEEAMKEAMNRTGLPFYSVHAVIKAYQDILIECVKSGVEVKMGELGVMTWKIKAPSFGVVYYDFFTGEKLPPKDVPGFNIPHFRPSNKWKKELREQTEYWNNEEKENSD